MSKGLKTKAVLISITTKDNIEWTNIVPITTKEDIQKMEVDLERNKSANRIIDYKLQFLGDVIMNENYMEHLDG